MAPTLLERRKNAAHIVAGAGTGAGTIRQRASKLGELLPFSAAYQKISGSLVSRFAATTKTWRAKGLAAAASRAPNSQIADDITRLLTCFAVLWGKLLARGAIADLSKATLQAADLKTATQHDADVALDSDKKLLQVVRGALFHATLLPVCFSLILDVCGEAGVARKTITNNISGLAGFLAFVRSDPAAARLVGELFGGEEAKRCVSPRARTHTPHTHTHAHTNTHTFSRTTGFPPIVLTL